MDGVTAEVAIAIAGGVSVLGFVLVMLFVSPFRRRPIAAPPIFVEGVEVVWLPGADRTWPGLADVLVTLRHYVTKRFPHNERALWAHLTLEIHRADTPRLRGNGQYVAPSHSRGARVQLRQMRAHAHDELGRWRMTGPLLPADRSALFHMFCEHHIPFVVTGRENSLHNARWYEETQLVSRMFARTHNVREHDTPVECE